MDDAVKRFRERRVYRLSKRKEPRYDSVEAFRERRAQRLREREDADWKESDHKRDKGGRFASKDGGSGGAAKKPAANKLAAASTKSTAKTTSGGVVGSTYTRAYKTSGGVSYPTPKKGAVYDEDTLKEVNRLADSSDGTTQPKTKSQEAVLKKLTGKDLTYQTDPDGTVVASIPGLSQMYDSKVKGKSPAAQAAYDKRIEAGKQITKDMIAISNRLGSRMMGLENCFKGGESTSRKIDKVKKKLYERRGYEVSDEEALSNMDDVVRFSYKCDHGKMVEQIYGLERALVDQGYEITERDNKFLPKDDGTQRDYKAVHLQVKAPNGELFEVQVQSEETIKVKNKNHSLYERSRKLPDDSAEKAALVQQMVDNWKGLVEPENILKMPSVKKKKQ